MHSICHIYMCAKFEVSVISTVGVIDINVKEQMWVQHVKYANHEVTTALCIQSTYVHMCTEGEASLTDMSQVIHISMNKYKCLKFEVCIAIRSYAIDRCVRKYITVKCKYFDCDLKCLYSYMHSVWIYMCENF